MRMEFQLDAEQRALTKVVLVPQLIQHYALELRLLTGYQWFQVAVLALLLMAWGF